jgi:hypothetical protein
MTVRDVIIVVGLMGTAVHVNLAISASVATSFVIPSHAVTDVLAFTVGA